MDPVQKALTRVIHAFLWFALSLVPLGLWKLFELLQALVRLINR